MSFNTLDFLLLFGLTFCLYYILPQKLRNPLLLAASYVFYAAYNLGLTLYLLIITLFTFLIAIQISKNKQCGKEKAAKYWTIAGVAADLGVLAFYKYFNFAAEILAGILNVEAVRSTRLVPFGISFITFSTISYLVDIYRAKYAAEKNLLKYALYVSFFPKIGQGPIQRADEILPQFDQKHTFDILRYREGMIQMLYGLFMKMVVADTAAIVVDTIYGNLGAYSGAAILLATVLFAIQLYCDFAGYSYTAIGAAKVLGFNMKQNFRQPYLSHSVGEFWRRWHISLNTWLRDYIYIPLGGSRCSKARKNLNVLTTFTFSGLWHGADWGYIVWGFLNGFYVIVESTIQDYFSKIRIAKIRSVDKAQPSPVILFVKKLGSQFITFLLVLFSWIFFRARKLSVAFTVISRIFTKFNLMGFLEYAYEKLAAGAGTTLYGLDVVYQIPMLIVAVLIVIVVDLLTSRRSCAQSLANGSRFLRWIVCYALIFAILLFGVYGYGYSAGAFIYSAF